MDWFLYDKGLHYERVKVIKCYKLLRCRVFKVMLRLFFNTFKNFKKWVFKLIRKADKFLRHFDLPNLVTSYKFVKLKWRNFLLPLFFPVRELVRKRREEKDQTRNAF